MPEQVSCLFIKESMTKLNQALLSCLLAISVGTVYAVTLDYPFFFDDFPNIVKNAKIQCTSIFDVFFRSLFYADTGFNNRPLSYASFAVNWAISGDNTISFRLLNILIHTLASIMLFKTILLLFKTPAGRRVYASETCVSFTAAVAAALWALNPIQTQAVTYIVQRMASMAAMFCILSLFFYLKARTDYNLVLKRKIPLLGLSFAFFVLGFFSKENAALLPVFILLMEFVFFNNIKALSKKNILILLGILLFIFTFAQFFTSRDIIDSILKGYSDRPFTLQERLLTQFRIVFYYLTQIFYPIPQRLSLLHNTELSVSLFQPVTTLLTILFFAGAVVFALMKKDRFPLISFAILFFITGHLVESTIIPLELMYEHRNYLPSIFIFMPVAFYLFKLAEFYKNKNRGVGIMLYAFVVLLLIGFGTGTYARNLTWSSQKSLWEDCIQKADTKRAWHNLAHHHYDKIGKHDVSKKLYLKALEKRNITKNSSYILTYENLGNLYYTEGNISEAKKYWKKAVPLIKENATIGHTTYYGLSKAESANKNYENAIDYINKAIQKRPDKIYYSMKGIIYMNMHDYDAAFDSFRECLRADYLSWRGYYDIGAFLTLSGYHERGGWFLRQALEKQGANYLEVMIHLIQNRALAGDMLNAENYAIDLINRVSHKEILNKMNYLNRNEHETFSVNTEVLLPIFENQYKAAAEQFR